MLFVHQHQRGVYKQFPHLLFCAVIEKSKVNKLPFSGLACVSQSNQQDDTVDMKMGIDHLVIKLNSIKIKSGQWVRTFGSSTFSPGCLSRKLVENYAMLMPTN